MIDETPGEGTTATKGRKKRTTTKRTPEGAAPSIDAAAKAADGVMVVSLVPTSGPLFRVEGPLPGEDASTV
ncbi:MAG: hypothetical protein LBR22_10415, partial [Desulfovibrio sp.]|nr:hypothetical protein [Desulfovibrio sp.]